jgi:transposase
MSEYSNIYDIVVDKGHLLRKIKEEIDFSFVNELLKKSYCEHFGRPAKEPELMFKILFLKKLYDISDEALIEQIRVNMAYKYFLGMQPEEEPVDSSLLSKFRKTRITLDMLEDMLKETVRQAIDKGLIKSTAIIVDSTHTHARYKHQSPTAILRQITKELRKEIYATDYDLSAVFPEKPEPTAELSEEIAYTQKLIEAVRTGIAKNGSNKSREFFKKAEELLKNEKIRELQSACDKDARIGHKKANSKFFGYKNHVAITEERIVVGVKVTNGAAGDGKQLPDLLAQTKENGIAVTEVIGDAAYSGNDNLEIAKQEEGGFDLVSKLHPGVTEPFEREGFTFNKDANTYVCQAGHAAIRCGRCFYKKERKTILTYYFSKKICVKCPLGAKCNLPKTSYSFDKEMMREVHKEQIEFQNSERFKARYRQRYKI